MKRACVTCRGVGSLDPRCKGRQKCPRGRRLLAAFGTRTRCDHAPCETCKGRGIIDDDVWYGDGRPR